jgi:hypothetical protein
VALVGVNEGRPNGPAGDNRPAEGDLILNKPAEVFKIVDKNFGILNEQTYNITHTIINRMFNCIFFYS